MHCILVILWYSVGDYKIEFNCDDSMGKLSADGPVVPLSPTGL